MSTAFVSCAPGSFGSPHVMKVEVVERAAGGFWVILGYDHHLLPIAGWVPDEYVLEIEVEPAPPIWWTIELDADDSCEGELVEAA